MNKCVCDECELGLVREDCSDNEYRECLDNKYNRNLYSLYFVEEGSKESFYGAGDKAYMCELINDYIYTNEMHGKEEIMFKVKRGLFRRNEL